MVIRFHRKLTRRVLLREYDEQYGSVAAPASKARKDPAKRAILEEWKFHLRQKDLNEEVALDHALVFHDQRAFLRAWSSRRLALYEYLKTHRDVDSLNQLAKRVRRNYRNVYEDAQRLAEVGVIALERHANSLVPKVLADGITVEI